jgi:hypothetical protein
LRLSWIDEIDEEAASAALKSIKELDSMNLSEYRVVGNYVRYDEEVRNRLKRLKQRIIDGLPRSSFNVVVRGVGFEPYSERRRLPQLPFFFNF